MGQNLKQLFQIQQTLLCEGFPDYVRVSKEICDFCEGSEKRISEVLNRIKCGEPWEYIRGFTEFCGYRFLVNDSVLIPRIETEQIVDMAKQEIVRRRIESVIDVGTGSGCIIISLAKIFGSSLNYIASDISNDALEMAIKNAQLNGVEKDVSFVRTDLVDGIKIFDNTLIVANLPYIPTHIYNILDHSVTDYEPKLALEAGEDGLRYYSKLIDDFNCIRKKRNIHLLIEIDPSIEEGLHGLLSDREVHIVKDLNNLSRFALISLS